MRDFDDFIPGLTLRAAGTPTRSRSSRSTPGCATSCPVTKHHDGFCWWDSPLTRPHERAPGPAPGRHRRARRRVARGTTWSSGSTTRCSTGGIPTTPTRERYVDALPAPAARRADRAVPAPAALGRRALGPRRRWWRADRIVEDYYAAMDAAGLEGCVNDRFNASARRLRGLRVRRPRDAARRARGSCAAASRTPSASTGPSATTTT